MKTLEICMKKIDNRKISALLVFILCTIYCYSFLFKGWIPHDAGTLAQTAERIIHGEIPHVDFDEMYTGGLSYLHALGFKIFGVKLSSLRIVFFIFLLPYIFSCYWLASRVASSFESFVVTVLCVVWSVPNYMASMASWYNLFFAVYGSVFVFQYIKTRCSRYLFLAGLCGGLSFIVKITGLYYILSVVFVIFYLETTESNFSGTDTKDKAVCFSLIKSSVLLIIILINISLVKNYFNMMVVIHFLLPIFFVCVYLIYNEWREGKGGFLVRLWNNIRMYSPFIIGISLPVILLLVFYISKGYLQEFINGLFLLPQKRFKLSFYPLPPFYTIISVLFWVAIFFIHQNKKPVTRLLLLILSIFLLAVLLFSYNPQTYRSVWFSLRPLVPLCAFLILFFLFKADSNSENKKRVELFYLTTLFSCLSLIQYPFSNPIYFCYFVPSLFLGILYYLKARFKKIPGQFVAISVFLILFGTIWLNTGKPYFNCEKYVNLKEDKLLLSNRANILVSERDKIVYEKLVEFIHCNGGDSDFIYAFPDCPEVYFLSKKRNPTKVIFDFYGDSVKTNSLIKLINTNKIKLAVINSRIEFSHAGINRDKYEILAKHFDYVKDIGWFRVLYRK